MRPRFLILSTALALLLQPLGDGSAAQEPAETATETAGSEKTAGSEETIGMDERLGATVALDVNLVGEDGGQVALKDLLGKPTILTLNYYSCAGICTPLLNGVADVLNRVRPEPGRDFRVITVSFDPKDTPEIALQKRTNYLKVMERQFPPEGWRFLVGERAATKKLCDSVGFRFRADENGKDFIHPGAIIFLSPEGKVTRYMYGTAFLPSDVEMALQEARKGEARPTISKLLQFCFSYDPEGDRYVFSMTKAVGAMTVLFIIGFVIFLTVFKGKPRKTETSS